jgi:predicted transcriptional regulator
MSQPSDRWADWSLILSPVAVRLWRYLTELQDQSPTLLMADLTTDLHASKTAIRNALAELVEYGFVAVQEEL